MRYDESNLAVLLDDMDASIREFETAFPAGDPRWERGPAGKWTTGQHADHLGRMYALSAGPFEQAVADLRAGRLGPRPRRGLLQTLLIRWLTSNSFPRGAKALPTTTAGPTPAWESAWRLVREGAGRHRRVAEALAAGEADRLWIYNPFAPGRRWHYVLPEMVRVHATHTRHHLKLAREGVGAAG